MLALNLIFLFNYFLVVFLLRIHAWSSSMCCASSYTATYVKWDVNILEHLVQLLTLLLTLAPQFSNDRLFHGDPVSLRSIDVFFKLLVELSEEVNINISKQLFDVLGSVFPHINFKALKEVLFFHQICIKPILKYLLAVLQNYAYLLNVGSSDFFPESVLQIKDGRVYNFFDSVVCCFGCQSLHFFKFSLSYVVNNRLKLRLELCQMLMDLITPATSINH